MEIIRPDGKKEVVITISEDAAKATLFRHFKGNLYKIITLARNAETLDEMVIYQGQYENNTCWVREKENFFSLIDKHKYPDLKENYRFEVIKEKKNHKNNK